jgi:hypothetical protein
LSLQLTGQLPSHLSGASVTPLPHTGVQALSLTALQPDGQQESPLPHTVMGAWPQARLHVPAPPEVVSDVQLFPSLHEAGQLPSHVSPGSTTALPQTAGQSLSLLRLQPDGQQPSPPVQAVMLECPHVRLHAPALPDVVSVVQLLPSLQLAGQLPSQVSPVSTAPLPHVTAHSLSLLLLQPGAQQPSPVTHVVMSVYVQTTLHWLVAPLRVSVVQTLLSLQDAGQLPSQVSPDSTVPLPQLTEHSLSFVLLQPGAQQPSPLEQTVIAE